MDNNSISTELSSQDERNKLLNEIALLKSQISLLETTIETPKFGELQIVENPSRLLCDNKDAIFNNIPDVQKEWCYELYQFAGMRCVYSKGDFVFEISSTNSVTKNDVYAIEILIDDNGHGKLGKWVLPMSINVSEILSRYPIDNLNNIKHFVKSCKYHIDCYVYRKEQVEKLQNLFSEIKNVNLSYSIRIDHIELTMLQLKDIDNNEFYNVILYLYYNSAEVKPCKLFTDIDSKKKPSPDLNKRLNKYFKPFLKMDLSLAFLQVSESQNKFVWKKILVSNKEDSNIECHEESSDEDNFLTEFLHKSKIKENKKLRKRKNKKQDKKNILHENEMETSLCVEGEKNQKDAATDDFSEEDKEIKSKKRKRSKKINSNRNKKKQSEKLLNKSNYTNDEQLANSEKEEKQIQKLKEKRTTSKRKKNDRQTSISNSTPISKKLPNRKFFHDISSIMEQETNNNEN